MRTISFSLNNKVTEIEIRETDRVLDVLRDQLGLTGTKDGCEIGECGACTILVNGRAINSCLMTAAQLNGTRVLTVEGLGDIPLGKLLQEAFINCGAIQCGFCTPGMLLSAYAILLDISDPTEEEIRIGLSGNLCRCTGYEPIIQAVLHVAKERKEKAVN